MNTDDNPPVRYFNIIARYTDHDGGVYEWQGIADDSDDAERRAQQEAWEDNHPSPGEDEKPYDMLEDSRSGGMSIIDITENVEAKNQVIEILEDHGHDELARKVDQLWR